MQPQLPQANGHASLALVPSASSESQRLWGLEATKSQPLPSLPLNSHVVESAQPQVEHVEALAAGGRGRWVWRVCGVRLEDG